MSSIDELNELDPLGIEFEAEVVEGLALIWMKGVAESDGERLTFRAPMGVRKAREVAAALVAICDGLDEATS